MLMGPAGFYEMPEGVIRAMRHVHMAGLGLGGEGYLSYSIATPTGEGVTNPRTFCRVRRCVMVDNLRIY